MPLDSDDRNLQREDEKYGTYANVCGYCGAQLASATTGTEQFGDLRSPKTKHIDWHEGMEGGTA